MTIKISNFNSGLQGAEAVAFGLLSARLGGDIAAHQRQNVWNQTLTLVCASVGTFPTAGGEGFGDAKAVAELAVRKTIESLRVAVQGSAVVKALTRAGFGNLDQIVTDGDGKEGASVKVTEQLRARYGERWKFSNAIKNALSTLDNYSQRIIRAVNAGVVIDASWTQRQLDDATKKAELAMLGDEERKELSAKEENAKTAMEVGKDFSGLFLSGDASTLAIIGMTRACLQGFGDADSVLQDAFLQALEGFAEKFMEAHDSAQAAREEGEALAAIPEGTEESSEPQAATA